MNVVGSIVDRNLCMGCGTCAGVCPTNAIKMKISEVFGIYHPFVDEEKCIDCELCLNVCPGDSLDLEYMNKQIINEGINSDSMIGEYNSCYIGYSENENIRFEATSGGLVTQILVYMLENGLITGALVTKMNDNEPIIPESYIAATKQEIIGASTSKYCPVSANVALKHILKNDGKYAVVGLPCHLHGIRKAEHIFPILKDRIVMHIGLLCSHMVNFHGLRFLMDLTRINIDDITKLKYRGSGWPGKMTIVSNDDHIKEIPLIKSWFSYWPVFSSNFFTPIRCAMCPDFAAEVSDMSFGDAWLPEVMDDTLGHSIVVTRNEYSDNLLHEICSANKIFLNNLSINDFKRSQAPNIVSKKLDLANRLKILKLKKYDVPVYNPLPKQNNGIMSKIRNYFMLFNIKMSYNNFFRKIFIYMPLPLFRLYYGIVKLLNYNVLKEVYHEKI